MGNSRARAVYEALLPDGFRRPQTDSSLEAFVRAKYEQKKYLAREWVQPPPPKVDWDKEIDEELEKQKKKKKSTANAVSTIVPKPKTDAIPQLLPKPNAKVNSSPVSGRNSDRNKSGSTDLLGLDTKPTGFPEDFSGFLSAELNKVDVKPIDKADSLKAEEDNFFNQPAPSEKEKAKLTKDSILALYDAAPANNTQFQNNAMSYNNYSVPTAGSSFALNQGNTFTNNQVAFSINASNQFNPKNSFPNFANQQQFASQSQFNAFQSVSPVQTQLHQNSGFLPTSNVYNSQCNTMNFQQNGSNFGNTQFPPNSSILMQGTYAQNNVLPMNNTNHTTTNGFTPDQNFGQTNQYFGLSQQFDNMGLNTQNQFSSASNIWQ